MQVLTCARAYKIMALYFYGEVNRKFVVISHAKRQPLDTLAKLLPLSVPIIKLFLMLLVISFNLLQYSK